MIVWLDNGLKVCEESLCVGSLLDWRLETGTQGNALGGEREILVPFNTLVGEGGQCMIVLRQLEEKATWAWD